MCSRRKAAKRMCFRSAPSGIVPKTFLQTESAGRTHFYFTFFSGSCQENIQKKSARAMILNRRRTFGTTASPPAPGKEDSACSGIAASPPAPGGEDDVVFGNTGLFRMTGGIARPGNAACPQAPGKTAACSAVRRLNPERGAARRSRGGKRRKSAGIPASSLHGRHRGAQTVGERTVCAVSVFQTCGRDAARGIVLRHVCPAPQSDGFAGRRVAAEALHGMGKAGKYRAAPAYFPKKREIRRRLRRRTMYKRSSFDTAMSYSRKAALASR